MIILLAALGLCWILMYGSIFDAVRWHLFPKLSKCSLCLGFWCGVVVFILSQDRLPINVMAIISHGLASAGICWFADHVRKLVDELITILRFFTEE